MNNQLFTADTSYETRQAESAAQKAGLLKAAKAQTKMRLLPRKPYGLRLPDED